MGQLKFVSLGEGDVSFVRHQGLSTGTSLADEALIQRPLGIKLYVYVDDGRVTGHCRELCWSAGRKFASVCSKNGVQDAARNRTFPSHEPGPWAGNVCHTSRGEIIGTVSQEKWEKTRTLVTGLTDMVADSADIKEQECEVTGKTREQMEDVNGFSERAKVSRQRMLEIRGFLNYVIRTYVWLAPYTKGMHNMIDGWRYDRNSEGWKLRGRHLHAMLAERFQILELCRDDNVKNAGGDRGKEASSDLGKGDL